MTAQDILDKRMAEIQERTSSRKAAQAALVAAYPDIKGWLSDLREAGFSVTVGAFTHAIHGPMQTPASYEASIEMRDAKTSGKGRR